MKFLVKKKGQNGIIPEELGSFSDKNIGVTPFRFSSAVNIFRDKAEV